MTWQSKLRKWESLCVWTCDPLCDNVECVFTASDVISRRSPGSYATSHCSISNHVYSCKTSHITKGQSESNMVHRITTIARNIYILWWYFVSANIMQMLTELVEWHQSRLQSHTQSLQQQQQQKSNCSTPGKSRWHYISLCWAVVQQCARVNLIVRSSFELKLGEPFFRMPTV